MAYLRLIDFCNKDRIKSPGFTIIEILVVVVIIVIVGVIVISRWPKNVITLNAQAELLANDIRLAQSLAMTQGQRYRIVFNMGGQSYQILDSTGAAVNIRSGMTTITLGQGGVGLNDITFQSTNLPNSLINFDTNGVPYTDTATPGAQLNTTGSITLQTTDGTKTINIIPQTGMVYIQ